MHIGTVGAPKGILQEAVERRAKLVLQVSLADEFIEILDDSLA
jgi:hypothetical protein